MRKKAEFTRKYLIIQNIFEIISIVISYAVRAILKNAWYNKTLSLAIADLVILTLGLPNELVGIA